MRKRISVLTAIMLFLSVWQTQIFGLGNAQMIDTHQVSMVVQVTTASSIYYMVTDREIGVEEMLQGNKVTVEQAGEYTLEMDVPEEISGRTDLYWIAYMTEDLQGNQSSIYDMPIDRTPPESLDAELFDLQVAGKTITIDTDNMGQITGWNGDIPIYDSESDNDIDVPMNNKQLQNYPIEVKMTDVPAGVKEAQLYIRAYDVDEERGEIDTVYLNNHEIGKLSGNDQIWNTTVLNVPVQCLRKGDNFIHFTISDGWVVTIDKIQLLVDGGNEQEDIVFTEESGLKIVEVKEVNEQLQVTVTANVEVKKSGNYTLETQLISPAMNNIDTQSEQMNAEGSYSITKTFALKLDSTEGVYTINGILKDKDDLVLAREVVKFVHVRAPKVQVVVSPNDTHYGKAQIVLTTETLNTDPARVELISFESKEGLLVDNKIQVDPAKITLAGTVDVLENKDYTFYLNYKMDGEVKQIEQVVTINNLLGSKIPAPLIEGKGNSNKYPSQSWSAEDVELTILPYMNGSNAAKEVSYQLNGGTEKVYTAPFKVEATTSITAASKDAYGNVSEVGAYTIYIDKIAPSISEKKVEELGQHYTILADEDLYTNKVQVGIQVADKESGMKQVFYQWVAKNGSLVETNWLPYEDANRPVSPIKFEGYLAIKAVDKVGNETLEKIALRVDQLVGDVVRGIDGLPNPKDITEKDKTKVYAVADSFNKLTTEQKKLVTVAQQMKLEECIKKFKEEDTTIGVKDIIDRIISLPESWEVTKDHYLQVERTLQGIMVDYKKLGTNEQQIIDRTNDPSWPGHTLKEKIEALKVEIEKWHKEEITYVNNLIEALPQPETITVANMVIVRPQVIEAKKAYDNLTTDQKDAISKANKEKLQGCIDALIKLLEYRPSVQLPTTTIEVDGLLTSVVPEIDGSNVTRVIVALQAESIDKELPSLNEKMVTLAAYDISLLQTSYRNEMVVKEEKIQPDDTLTLRIAIPSAYKNYKDIGVVYITDNGTAYNMYSRIIMGEDGLPAYVEFETNHFSTYALVTDKNNIPDHGHHVDQQVQYVINAINELVRGMELSKVTIGDAAKIEKVYKAYNELTPWQKEQVTNRSLLLVYKKALDEAIKLAEQPYRPYRWKEGVQGIKYIVGYPDGTFRPDKVVTREEAAAMFARLIEVDEQLVIPTYTDVKGWSQESIDKVTSVGLMEGYEDGTFRPTEGMTTLAFSQMIARMLGMEDEVNAIEPSQILTRAEAVIMLNQAIGLEASGEEAQSSYTDLTPKHPGYQAIIAATKH